jgi:cytochrome c5
MKKSMFRFFAVGTALGIALDFPLAVRAQNESEAVYKAKCGMCHGAHGSGLPMGKMSEKEHSDIITNGKNKMPLTESL